MMVRSFHLLSLLSVVALTTAACGQETAAPGTDADSCGAGAFAHLIGQPEDALAPLTLPPGSRVLHPDDVATLDYLPERLNIDIGADGMIAAIRCG